MTISISVLTYTFKSYTRAWKVWRPCQQRPNPCNFLIWMHVELLPNRTRPSDQRQGMPRGSCQRQFVSSFGLFSWQVAPVAHSCSCCATTWVSACSLSSQARPIGRWCLAFPELRCSCILTWISPPKPKGPDRPDVPTHRTREQRKNKRVLPGPEAFAASKASPLACWRRLRAGAATPSTQAPNAQVLRVASILSAMWAPFLAVQQRWPRTCSPRTREAFSMVSHCGQSAKLAGNTLHQIQDCGGRTALHALGPSFLCRRNPPCISPEDAHLPPALIWAGDVTIFCHVLTSKISSTLFCLLSFLLLSGSSALQPLPTPFSSSSV